MKKGKRKSTGSIIIAWIIFLLFIINMIPIVEGHATAPDYSYVKTDDWHLNLTAHPEFNIGGLGVFDFIIDSKGNYYYQSSNSVRKSTDGGKTWNVVLFGIYSGGLNCLSDDTLIATGQKGNVAKVWISRDYGANWINHLNTTTGQIWNSIGISSSPNGDIFIGEYAQGNEKGRYLYRSYDHGLTWNSTNISNYMWTLDWANFNHIHTVFSAGNNELYVTIGDGRQTPVRQTLKSIDRGVTFSTISTADAWTGMIKVNGSFYMGSDSGGGIWKTSDWIDWDCKMWNQLRDTDTFGWLSALEYDNKNNVMYAATSSGTTSNAIGIENIIMCSPDMGDHWGVLYKSNLSIKSVNFDPLHQKIWFVTFDHEAYEISTLTNNEARHLIGNYRVESYNIETHFLTDRGNAWLSNYEKPLKNVTVTITPVAQNNLLTNPSFENDSEGWNVDKGSSIIFDATSPFGQHVARITNGTQKIQSKAWLAVDPSTQYIGSVYCKNIGMVNTTNPSLIMYVQEYTDQYAFIRRDSLGSYAINIQEWIRFAKNITTDPSCHFIRFYLTCSDQREIAGTYFLFDGAMLVKSEMITPFVIGNQGMINYTVDIDGQKFSGTNIKSQSTHVFQGILAGLTCINATMNGSRLATIEIRGEQIVRGDGILVASEVCVISISSSS